MTTVTIEIDDKSLDGKRFLSFLETLGCVSIVSKKGKKLLNGYKTQKTYTAMDFLEEWSGGFKQQLDDEDVERLKYEYLTQKYK